jgi:hypothetical protein
LLFKKQENNVKSVSWTSKSVKDLYFFGYYVLNNF